MKLDIYKPFDQKQLTNGGKKWFVLRWHPWYIEEMTCIGETHDFILFEISKETKQWHESNGFKSPLFCKVSKVYVGSIYFETRAEAEAALKKRLPVELIEPSDAERAAWPDATRNYVEQLEQFYDNHNNQNREKRTY